MKNPRVYLGHIAAALRVRKTRVLVCFAVLVIGLVIATMVTPFQEHSQQRMFFDDENAGQAGMTYMRAEVMSLDDTEMVVRIIDGSQSGAELPLARDTRARSQLLTVGSTVIVGEYSEQALVLVDNFRVPILIIMSTLFVVLVLAVGGRRGGTSLIGLTVGLLVIGWLIVPLILQGHDAFWVCMVSAYLIAGTSIFIAHGIRRRTVISLICIAFVLGIVCVLSGLATLLASLSGIYDETTFYLSQDLSAVDMRGMIAGGIIIATLGVLDDIVTAQVAVVEELKKANPRMTVRKLYTAGASVGREHIASLVNTLALAYAGASLPLIVFLAHNYTGSVVMLLNSEYLAIEIVRTLVASSGLVLAVPVSTLTAAYMYHRLAGQGKRAQRVS